jgi:hypothetical protein
MINKVKSASHYIGEHKGAFLIGGVVTFVFGSNLATSYLDLKATDHQIELAKLHAARLF